MKIDGIGDAKRKVVSLSEFFDGQEITVIVKPLAPYNKAKINELLAKGVKYYYDDSGKPSGMEKAYPAEDQREIYLTKLLYGVVEHTIKSDGKPITWDEKLFQELNDHDPAILDKVADAVHDLTFPERPIDGEEGDKDENPTSPEKKSGK